MAEPMRAGPRRFFDDENIPDDARPAVAVPYSHPRAATASAQVIDLRKRNGSAAASMSRNKAWQEAAWGYYDQVGELKFAFNLISQVVSRALIFPAVIEDTSEVPIEAKAFLDEVKQAVAKSAASAAEPEPKATLNDDAPAAAGSGLSEAAEKADSALRSLVLGGQAELLRLFALNLSIPGECYLVHDGNKYLVASISELTPGNPPQLKHSNTNLTGEGGAGKKLDRDAYVARIWRSHPRWSAEADSSMLGVLDQVEKLVLFDQVMRTISRSRLSAGIIFIPSGLTPVGEKSLEESLIEVTTQPIEDESVASTVTPLLLTGPPELGDKIKRIDLSRQIDEQMTKLSDMAIDRVLAGLDIPKNIVAGMQETRYSNALVIDDSLYKAHIEPLILMICDALTQAYLRPALRRAGVEEEIVNKFVVWYNPSAIVTRPDRSQAANEGFDRYLLSGEAWRRARGYSDLDKPDEDELIRRLALEKATIPPDVASVLLESIHPEFFHQARAAGQSNSGVPSDVADILSGKSDGEVAQSPNVESATVTEEQSGGDISNGGAMPPRPDNLER